MESIEQMIKRLCPEGVEYVKLVDYANVQYGYAFDASKFTEDDSYIPLIRIRDVLSGKAGTFYTGYYSNDYIIKKGDILVGMDGNFNLGVWNDIDGLLNQRVCKLYTKDNSQLLNGFIKHYMKPIFRKIELNTPGGSVKHLSAKAINSIEIPLPPMEIQARIVEILDKMTTLEAELEAELEARKQQYEYYRNNLFKFKEGECEWKKIGEVCTILTGGEPQGNIIKGVNKDPLHPYAIYGNGAEVYGWSDSYRVEFDAVTISSIGANTGAVYYRKGPFTPIIRLKVILPNENLNRRFLYHILKTIKIKKKKSSVPNMNADEVKSISIPIPSMEEQSRIVSILDRFEALTTDLQSGLPGEIEARRQQYEYYRNRLLTFERKTA